MKRILVVSAAAVLLTACSGDLKKQIEQKNQLLAAQQAETAKLKDDMAAREADLKNQCEQRVQKLQAQQKHQVDALNAKIAELSKKKEAEKAQKSEASKAKSKTRR